MFDQTLATKSTEIQRRQHTLSAKKVEDEDEEEVGRAITTFNIMHMK